MSALKLSARGFVIVALVAANVRHIASGEYGWAFLTGAAISVLWWLNAGLASEARKHPSSAVWYGLGAGLGTVMGMWIGS